MCGGTAPSVTDLVQLLGLSPRVRGNLALLLAAVVALRSIPACAGEPTTVTP